MTLYFCTLSWNQKIPFQTKEEKLPVTAQCQMLHGTIFDSDSTEASTYTPPLHFRCQSNLLSVTILDEYDDSQLFENRDWT
jgi:hypothetical protein